MKLASVTIQGFRCFDHEGETIELDDLTCFVGPNASGKTAAMLALVRMFGERRADRMIVPSDFHLKQGEALKDEKERKLSIEVVVVFPEIGDEGANLDAVPEVFNQMMVSGPGADPYCRIRLDATWTDDGTAEGDVDQHLHWVTRTSDLDENGDKPTPVRPGQRARIRVVYASAERSLKNEVRPRTGNVLGHLVKSIRQEERGDEIRDLLDELTELVGDMPGLHALNETIQSAWDSVYDGRIARQVAFAPEVEDPLGFLDSLSIAFRPDETGDKMGAHELSDGLRALFAVSLPLGLFSLADRLRAGTEVPGFIDTVGDDLPYLTIFAVEEPENHLSPHYLGKVVTTLKRTAVGGNAQVLLSSHSPSIMARIDPENVRYFLGGEGRENTVVKCISLPPSTDEAYKYVREAVRGFPELYFSRLVVLGEGPSEEIVLRRAFEASGNPLDELFVSVVPIGGRHVHHFWKLLRDLDIPYLTLLDLDLGRKTGGMGRVDNIIRELVHYHGEDVNVDVGRLRAENPDSEFEVLLARLSERYDVYFVAPLDLDYAMLKAYPDVYKRPRPGGRGPDIPTDIGERTVFYENRARQVLGLRDQEPIASEYPEGEHNLFAWYSYLFLSHSKPVTHMHALVQLASEPGWVDRLPEALSRLVARAKELVSKDGDD